MEEFRSEYTGCDIFLVDDIQYLAGKEETQKEFLLIFDELYNAKKQIVFTSDRSILSLNFINRLKSRFERGVHLKIDSFYKDIELRERILKKQIKEYKVSFTEEIYDYILLERELSINEIHSLFLKINLISLKKEELTLKNIKQILKDKIEKDEEKNLEIEEIIDWIVSELNANEEELKKKKITQVKSIVIYLLQKLPICKLPKVLKLLRIVSYEIFFDSIEKTKKKMKKNREFRHLINYLEKIL